MTIVENILNIEELNDFQRDWARDTITLTWEERRRRHGRRRSDNGVDFAISLPGGALLKNGDCFALPGENIVVAVCEAQEPVYVIRPGKPQEWAAYAYHMGNRHQPVMIGESELIFLQNAAVHSLLEHLRVPYAADSRPFTAVMTGHSH
jgi:urease accessory protein